MSFHAWRNLCLAGCALAIVLAGCTEEHGECEGECPQACDLWTPCADGWYCQADGFCAEGCATAGCAEGEACDEVTQLCTPTCTDDAQCVEPFPECDDELVEPGEEAQCLPCVDPGEEPNDTMDEAVALGDARDALRIEGQRLCGADSDWYAFEVTELSEISIVVSVAADAAANVGVAVLDDSGVTAIHETTLGASGAPLVVSVPEPGQYFVRLYQVEAFVGDRMIRTAYDLSITQQMGCANDANEPNPGPEAAPVVAPATYEHLVLCGGEEDWFALELESGTSVVLELIFSNAEGNLDLHLVGPDGVVPLATSESETDGESIAHPVTSSGTYYVRVFASGVATAVSYDLTITVADISCIEDRLEPNATPSAATEVVLDDDDRFEASGLTLCQGDEDWFAIDASLGQLVMAEINFSHEAGDLQLELIDAEGFVLDSSVSFHDNEYIRFSVTSAGTYYLRVYGNTPYVANSYGMLVELGGEECEPDDLEPNDASLEAAEIELDRDYRNLTICVGEEDWYRLDASEGQIITVDTHFDTALYDLGATLYLLRDDGSMTWLAGSDTIGSRENIVFQTYTTGTFLVRIFRSRGTLYAEYDLTVDVTGSPCVRDGLEPNNTYLDATDVASGESYSDLSLCVADVDWYQIDLRNGQVLTAEITFTHAENDLGMQLYKLNSDGTISYRAGSDGLTDNESIVFSSYEDATFLVYVYRSRGTTTAGYDLSVEVAGRICAADAFEPNDSTRDATEVEAGSTYPRLTVCAGDSDWYRIEANNGQLLTAEIEFSHAEGDLGLQLFKLNDDGSLTHRATSDSLTDNERIAYRPFESGVFLIYVYRSRGALTGSYSLTVDVEGAACSEDEHEPNNDPSEAARIASGTYDDLTLCVGDEDWYRFDLERGQLVRLAIEFTHALSDLGLALYRLNADGTITYRAGADTLTDDEYINYRTFEDGTYVARVYQSRGTVVATYDLSLSIEGDACVPDELEPNDSSLAPAEITDGTYRDLTLCPGEDDWYSFDVESGQLVALSIDFTHAESDLGLYLYRLNADGTLIYRAGSDTLTDHETVRYRSFDAGTYVARVYLSRGASLADYDLTFAIEGDPCPADGFEPNDAAADAAPIAEGLHEDLTLCVADDDWYSIEVSNGQLVDLDLTFSHAASDLGIQLFRLAADGTITYRAGSDTLTGHESIRYRSFDDGTFLIQVYRSRGTVLATYDLDVAVEGDPCVPDDFEPNDSVAEAADLAAGAHDDLTLCVGDLDWYAFEMSNGQVATIEMDFVHAVSDLGMSLYRVLPDGTTTYVAGADTMADGETIVYTSWHRSTYVLQVYRSRGTSVAEYDLSLAIAGTPCTSDTLEPNEHWLTAAPIIAGRTYGGLTLCVGDADYYSIALTERQVLTSTIEFTHAENDLALLLYRLNADGTVTGLASSDTVGDNETIVYSIPATGTYVLRAYVSRGTVTGRYSLTTRVVTP
jgi:hypothetical protein